MYVSKDENKGKYCPYCGAELKNNLLCINVSCTSHHFSVGNRVILMNRPDYGSGFIDKIIDYQTPFEYCIDESNDSPNSDLDLDNDQSIFIEKPIYRVKFKLFFDKIVPAEELRHEIFEKGSKVRTKSGIGNIKNVNLSNKKRNISYDIIYEDQSIKNLRENEIWEYFYNPVDAFLKYQFSQQIPFILNLFGRILHNTYKSNTIKFVNNSRLSLMPHQVFVAHELILQYSPRYILADEVGLGKTIEAGIFIKEMISRDVAKKILIIVPAALVEQWIFEFENKFSIKLEKFDSKFFKNIDRCDHPNIFFRNDTQKEYPFIICSLQMARMERYRKILSSLYWDIVIFDEAHHLRRYITSTGKYNETLGYLLARKLSEKTRSMLLLTATPIQLHSFDLFSLLQIIRPDLFINYQDFEDERKRIPIINMLIRNLRNFRNLNTFQQENTIKLLNSIFKTSPITDKGTSFFYNSILKKEIHTDIIHFDDIPEENNDYQQIEMKNETKTYLRNLIDNSIRKMDFMSDLDTNSLKNLVKTKEGRQKLLKKIQNYHFLSHFMIRNRKRIIFKENFVKRIINNIEVKQTEEEEKLYKELRLYLAKTYNQAIEEKNNALGFVMVILQKLLTSSAPALISSIEKRITKIESYIDISKSKISPDSHEYTSVEIDAYDWEDLSEDESFIIDKVATLKNEIELNKKHKQVLNDFLIRLKNLQTDSKLCRLREIIDEIYANDIVDNKKTIIFTQFKKTLFYIRDELSKLGYKIEEFHGDLDHIQKDKAIERFRNQSQILISTEVGGEGRNFQFCNILINYDLPWNPMKLEQRIGRLDRIGQKNDVLIYNFTTLGTVESRIFEVLIKRIKLFEESIGNLEPIITSIKQNFNKAILSEENIVNSVETFEDELIKNQNELEVISAQLEDFVLDKRSFQISKINELFSKKQDTLSGSDIHSFISMFFKYYEYDNKPTGEIKKKILSNEIPAFIVNLADKLQIIFGIDKKNMEGTFDLKIAQENEELDFFALGHPLINSISEFCREEAFRNPSTIISLDLNKIKNLFGKRLTLKELETLKKVMEHKLKLFFIEFETEYCGILLEKKNRIIMISSEGFILEKLSEFISKPYNFYQILKKETKNIQHSIINELSKINDKNLNNLIKIAKKYNKKISANKKSDLIKLNETMFRKELEKILSLHEYKVQYLLKTVESNKIRLKYLENKTPTKKQWLNLEKITDITRKMEKEEKYRSIELEISSLNIENEELNKKIENFQFDLPADIKRLEFYRRLSKRTWLSSIALINLI